MTRSNEEEELLDLLAFAFREAEIWLFDSVGRDQEGVEADRIREILNSHGKYAHPFDN